MSFVETQAESQLGERLLHQGQGLLSLSGGAAEHHEIVGIAHEAIAALMKPPVQMIENDVGQQRTDDPSYTVDNFRFFRFRRQQLRESNDER